MRFPSYMGLATWFASWAPQSAAPLIPTRAKVVVVRPIIDCPFVEIAEAATEVAPRPSTGGPTVTASITPRAEVDLTLPSAGTVREPAERSLVASIAAHAAISAVAAPRREPDDFLLARRLGVIARTNRPVGTVSASKPRVDAQERPRKVRPGPLSPVLARGTRPAFATPLSAAA